MIRAALAVVLLLSSVSVALGASQHYYLPQVVAVGDGDPVEVYVPTAFETSGRLTGAALADAALTALKAALPEAAAVTVVVSGRAAEVSLDPARATDADVADRALGAVFHTLRLAGVTDVRVGTSAVAGDHFTRPAFAPVASIAGALPPGRLGSGYVRVGAEVVPARAFYERLASGDGAVQAAARGELERASVASRLHLLSNLAALRLKDQDAVVIGRLSDASPQVRLAALKLLEGKATAPVLKALEGVAEKDAVSEVKLGAVRMLVALGRKEFEKYLLLDKLADPDGAVVVSALKGLVNTGDVAFAPNIAELVKHTNPVVREAAVDAVRDLKQLPLMVAWLDDAQVAEAIRERAARILADGATGPDRAKGLSYLVAKGGEESALYAAGVAESARVAGTTSALGAALGRSEATVRLAAAKALGALKDTAGLEPLAAAVRNATDAEERAAFTEQATAIIGAQPLDQVIQIARSTDVTVRELAIKSLAAFSQDRPNRRAIAVLDEALASKEAGPRQAAAYALARIPDAQVVANLVALKDDADPLVRAQVAYAVARSEHGSADAIVQAYLDDRETEVKVAAIEGVRIRKLTGALDKVKWLVDNRRVEVKREAMRALLALASPGDASLFDVYVKMTLEQDEALRRMAIEGLGGFKGDPRATRAIGGAVTDERASKALKLFALQTLATMTEPDTVEHVVRGLFDRDREVKLATLDALEQLKSNKAYRPLQEFILGERDAEVAARAEAVLEKL